MHSRLHAFPKAICRRIGVCPLYWVELPIFDSEKSADPFQAIRGLSIPWSSSRQQCPQPSSARPRMRFSRLTTTAGELRKRSVPILRMSARLGVIGEVLQQFWTFNVERSTIAQFQRYIHGLTAGFVCKIWRPLFNSLDRQKYIRLQVDFYIDERWESTWLEFFSPQFCDGPLQKFNIIHS